MKIYFSGSIRGGRDQVDTYSIIIEELKNFGEVVSEFISDKSLTSYGSLNMTDEDIYKRDTSMINDSEVVVADITTPSLGVGYEIAYAEKLGKQIYCLYQKQDGKRISAMIAGCPGCKVFGYKDKNEVLEIIRNIFKK